MTKVLMTGSVDQAVTISTDEILKVLKIVLRSVSGASVPRKRCNLMSGLWEDS